jgi:hypothetical protein
MRICFRLVADSEPEPTLRRRRPVPVWLAPRIFGYDPPGSPRLAAPRGSQGRKMKTSPTASCDLFAWRSRRTRQGITIEHRVPERVQTRTEVRTFEG